MNPARGLSNHRLVALADLVRVANTNSHFLEVHLRAVSRGRLRRSMFNDGVDRGLVERYNATLSFLGTPSTKVSPMN